MLEITYQTIGIVHSPYKVPEGTPIQPSVSENTKAIIEIFPDFIEGLSDLTGFSHIYILYHMHLIRKKRLTVIPFMDIVPHGVFSTRSPGRPNPIGISVVSLEKIEKNIIHIKNIDILDGSPVLDIKPYIPQFDVFNTTKNGWFDNATLKLTGQKDDGRFIKN